MKRILRFGTRRSPLARWQTARVIELLDAARPELRCEAVPFDTEGDRRLDLPLPEVGGKGLFTEALEDAMRSGAIDAAVHSLKDLPTHAAPGLVVAAVLDRADARDALVAPRHGSLAALPAGAIVGTCSPRRTAQLLALRPDLEVRPIRGNVGTRLRKVDDAEYDAAIFACAGLDRLGLSGRISERLSFDVMLPAPGQGALAVQCREDDAALLAALALVDDVPARAATDAERAFLAATGGGCSAPVAAYATATDAGVTLRARAFAGPDGGAIELSGAGRDPLALGRRLAAELFGSAVTEPCVQT